MSASTSPQSIPESFPAFLATKETDADGKAKVVRGVGALRAADLGEGEVTVRVHWSSVNYKDALATLADGGVARISPMVAGIDLAGEVVASESSAFRIGQTVIAHGYDIGVARHGAYAHYCRVPAAEVLALPAGLSARDAMVIGTGGFTAAASIHALETRGLTPTSGPVLVTGATGGVGSMAVSMLAGRGYTVAASTGKASEHGFLTSLGATEILDRSETSAESARPLEKERWAAVVDCVGGSTLAYALRTTRYGGAVAASGLTGGVGLTTTVLPFILRGVALLGIDSVQLDMASRTAVWARCGTDLRPQQLDQIGVEIGLAGLESALSTIRSGGARGRYVVRLLD
jgi:acrylyl-CoA reductase (NADPH)